MQTSVRRLEQAWQKEGMQIMSGPGFGKKHEELEATNGLNVAGCLTWLAECSTFTGTICY